MSELAVDGALALVDEPTSELDPTCFVFGGVAFEICPAPGQAWTLSPGYRELVGSYASSPVAGHVRCVVSPAAELREGAGREIAREWSGDVARVGTDRARAELRRLSPGQYVATAFVAPDAGGRSALLSMLTAAVVEREGGFVLHAAGVEIAGRGVLFLGPSGAGKSTAANHCDGARWFARDRALAYPTPLGWYTAGLPGGSDGLELPPSARRLMPLSDVYRIERGACEVSIRPSTAAQGLRDLRESVTSAPLDPAAEASHLERLAELQERVGVGRLSFPLGAALFPALAARVRREGT